MKHTNTVMLALFLFALASCSNDTVDVAQEVENAKISIADRAVSLEGKSLYGSYMKARFESAHRAYITMLDSRLSEDENLYTYSATPATLTLQMQKICAPDGSGLLVTQEGYIGYWNSESFKQSYITEGISDYYTTKTTTITASDGTVYTYTNKTSCSSSGIIKLTTSGTSKTSGGTESPLFSDLAGYTSIESDYSASEFTTVVTVTVYKETTTDGTTTTEADSAYALSLAGATFSEGSMVYSATDDATAEQLTDAQTVFEQRYNELSANDWYMVKAAFKPYSYTYDTNAAVTESYINDDDSITEESVIYDYVLTQHYTNFETAVFLNPLAAASGAMGAVLFGYGYDGNLYFISDSDSSEYEWRMESIDTNAKTITFYEITGGSEDDESSTDDNEDDENSTDDTEADAITARYTLIENGDSSTLTLIFESAESSPVSGETITLKYYPLGIGLNAE
ncbi:MAG: hypothetical protein IJ207_05395 [Treponema sp.]|uniref:hypothetical protein n=1 Tax=Treponema sp. TaxID=166 RepID=UPI0025D9316D|nr:hypothetical protein [Treponema sp.]MBQ9281616.1 hypothetical protein [Treponema sp.]